MSENNKKLESLVLFCVNSQIEEKNLSKSCHILIIIYHQVVIEKAICGFDDFAYCFVMHMIECFEIFSSSSYILLLNLFFYKEE